MIQGGEEEITRLSRFITSGSSKYVVSFIRSMLKPEIGHPLKEVDLKALKREDFLPYKIDNGFRAVRGDLNSIHFGEMTYIHKRAPLDKDFDESKRFYVYGPTSICTRTDLLKTREQLDEYPDQNVYREDENDAENEDDDEFAFDQAILDRFQERQAQRQQQRERAGQTGKRDKDLEQLEEKRFRLKKYSILEFKTRDSKKLKKTEKFDKLDNRVSSDPLRSGAGLIRKLRHPPLNVQDFPDHNQQWFIRDPIYHMYIPREFLGRSKTTKFLQFEHKIFYYGQRMRRNNLQQDYRNNHNCLYSKRLKKVIMRAKIFRNSQRNKIYMLALERVHCKGKIVNFEDPEQRQPFYNKLLKLKKSSIKDDAKQKYIDLESGTLPKIPFRPVLFKAEDYTQRQTFILKLDCPVKGYHQHSKQLEFSEDEKTGAQIITHFDASANTQKMMKEGQLDSREVVDKPSLLFRKLFYYTYQTNFSDTFGNDPVAYFNIRYSKLGRTNHFDTKTGLGISWVHDQAHREEIPANNLNLYNSARIKLFYLKKLEGEEQRYFEVAMKGSRKVFRFDLEGDPKMAVSMVFRRLYIVWVSVKKVELKVVTLDALAKYFQDHCDE